LYTCSLGPARSAWTRWCLGMTLQLCDECLSMTLVRPSCKAT